MYSIPGEKIRQDIQSAKKQEKQVAIELSMYYGVEVTPTYDQSAKYDGYFNDSNNDTVFYEVKDERKQSKKTGNHFVELRSRGKVSGIMTTIADIWVVQPDDETIFVIPTAELRFGLQRNAGLWREVLGGDYVQGQKSSIGVLVPLDWIESHPETIIIKTQY